MVTPIDLTADPSDTVARPPTLSQEEGLAAPEEPEKAQDGGSRGDVVGGT